MDRLTAEQIEELERLVRVDYHDAGGLVYARVTNREALALLAAARENAALRRECKAWRHAEAIEDWRGVDEARAETDRLGALEGE